MISQLAAHHSRLPSSVYLETILSGSHQLTSLWLAAENHFRYVRQGNPNRQPAG